MTAGAQPATRAPPTNGSLAAARTCPLRSRAARRSVRPGPEGHAPRVPRAGSEGLGGGAGGREFVGVTSLPSPSGAGTFAVTAGASADLAAEGALGRLPEALAEPVQQSLDRHPLLRHRVPLADRHLAVGERVEVDRHAEGRADLVLAAVAPADVAARLVLLHAEGALQKR